MLLWIVVSGIAMSLIALVGSLTLVLKQATLDKILVPLVAFAAGSLIGGALFHMIPASIDEMGNETSVYLWISAGFLMFLALEQFLNWHHSHQTKADKRERPPLCCVRRGIGGFARCAAWVSA